jgi:hypothetical protein
VRGESRVVQLSPEDKETVLKLRSNIERTLDRYHGLLRQFSEAAGVRIPEGRAVVSVMSDGNLKVEF